MGEMCLNSVKSCFLCVLNKNVDVYLGMSKSMPSYSAFDINFDILFYFRKFNNCKQSPRIFFSYF
jgi:hypothetical protein